MYSIEKIIPQLKSALAASRRVVLSAAPGAGKTTRVPLALLDCPWLTGKKIIMLEPRRLAARRAAEYMSQQLQEPVGRTVGYRIRGEAAVSAATRIEVVTEGILTRMLHSQQDLPDAGLVIFDEFHERSLHADLGLAFSLDVQKHLRPDLSILVMSATLDGLVVASLLGHAPIIRNEDAPFPVETRYARFENDKALEQRISEVVLRALNEEGDILVFLPGMREIRRVEDILSSRLPDHARIFPLHGDLAPQIQNVALAPAREGLKKVILSTSIAETSITIEGVRVVVDSGLGRTARFDPRKGMSGLVTIPISRAVADQRRGRAARLGPGVCYRLWTEREHDQRPEFPVPEIRQSDLAPLALDLALWGRPDGKDLAFLDPPPPAHLAQAQDLLQRLGALAKDGTPTRHGRRMAELAVHPRLSHMIIKAKEYGWGAVACELAAVLESNDALTSGSKNENDLMVRLQTLARGRSLQPATRERILAQKRRLLELTDTLDATVDESLCGIILSLAFPERLARKRPERSGSYQLANGMAAFLPESSHLVHEEFLAIAEMDAGTTDGKIFLAAAVPKTDIERVYADDIIREQQVFWDERENRVVARQIKRIGELIIEEKTIPADGYQAGKALLQGLRRIGLHALPWNKESTQLCNRVEWLRRVWPAAADWPDCSIEGLLASLEVWLEPFLAGLTRLDQLQRLQLAELLRHYLSSQNMRELDRLAPTHLQVPSGSSIAIEYGRDTHPVLSVKLQELFGLTATPLVAGGRIPVTIHLLSPAARPLAVTQDLPSFWKNVYPDIRKQLRARYPKHPWPEDPLTATPTKKTVRQLTRRQ